MLQTETSLTVSWNCLCRQPGLSDTLAMSSRPMGLPQRKPVGQKNSVGRVVRPEVVGWRIWDAAEMWLRRVGCRSRSGTGVLGLSESCAPWCWACTWLARVHRANAAECAAVMMMNWWEKDERKWIIKEVVLFTIHISALVSLRAHDYECCIHMSQRCERLMITLRVILVYIMHCSYYFIRKEVVWSLHILVCVPSGTMASLEVYSA